jgi:hypothetical protein
MMNDRSGAKNNGRSGLAAPSNDRSFTGGLAGRIAALAGIDPDNPDQPVPPPGGLLARLPSAAGFFV